MMKINDIEMAERGADDDQQAGRQLPKRTIPDGQRMNQLYNNKVIRLHIRDLGGL